jgi:endo-1,4-beta-xylanase
MGSPARPARRWRPLAVVAAALIATLGVILVIVTTGDPHAGGPEHIGPSITAAAPVTVLTQLPASPQDNDIPALKEVFAGEFAIGAAVSMPQLTGAQGDLLKGQFNSITPSNALKWAATEPNENVFDFTASDQIVNFAVSNDIKVRGHTLVWHNQTPAWVFQDAAGEPMTPTRQNRALLLSRMENHVRSLVSQYRERISTWDVVNEVLNDDGSMRQSMWYQITGLDYITDAFITAHAADPTAKLCINEVDLTRPAKRDAMFELVAELKAAGAPIDCIGSQMHVNIQSPTPAAVSASIDKFAQLGVDQQITEMDVSVYTDNTSSYASIPAPSLARQAAQYKALFAVFRKHREQISSVTFWGLADDQTWLNSYPIPRTDAPLLFDTQLLPKPAFWAVVGSVRP